MSGLDIYRYTTAAVYVFGIIGNILVVISILRQKNLLKSNYYFLVLQLAICDLGPLILDLIQSIDLFWVEKPLFVYSFTYCVFEAIWYPALNVGGLGVMLVISVLRYRATVHPLKPAICRRKLKIVCGLVYIAAFIAGSGPFVRGCFIDVEDVIYQVYTISCFYILPTIFLAVVYFKVGRALMKQNKYIKSVCSNPVRQNAPKSFINTPKFLRDRKTFFVCLITVLCYAVGHIPITMFNILLIAKEYYLLVQYGWILHYYGHVLRVAGSNAVNPLIYGILDKKLLTFWKLCRKKRPRSQEN
jgi:hypothetical protein